MNEVFNTYRPAGFHTINAYLFAKKPFVLIDFLKKAFYASVVSSTINPSNGDLANCILQIGDSCFMISQAKGKFANMCASFYLYVDDVDTFYENALFHGAQSDFKPADMDYRDRQAGIVDPSGNYWWISKRLDEKGYEE